MTNLLLHEFDNELVKRAAEYGADGGAVVKGHQAHWTAPLGGCSVGISIEIAGYNSDHFAPRLSMGSTSSLPSDPMLALARLRDSEATIHRALAAFAFLADAKVWPEAAPCDGCGGRGGRPSCFCGGTGKREAP